MHDGQNKDQVGNGDGEGGAATRRGPTFEPVQYPAHTDAPDASTALSPSVAPPVRPGMAPPPPGSHVPPPPTIAMSPVPPHESAPSKRFGSFAIGALVGGLACFVIVGAIGVTLRNRQEAEKVAEIEAAFESLDLDATGGRDLTPAEATCVEAEGVDLDDLLTSLTDTTRVGTVRQIEVLEAVIACAPSVLTEESFVATARQKWSVDPNNPLTDEEVTCAINDILTAPSPGSVLTGQDQERFVNAMELCFSPEMLGQITLAEGYGPQAYGDDAALDRLQDRCGQGTMVACDLLYQVSSVGSSYEAFASKCGTLQLVYGYCSPGLTDADGDGVADQDSPGWGATRAACDLYDMAACDLIFMLAPAGSEAERFGATCGDRRAIGVGGRCVAVFGEVSQR